MATSAFKSTTKRSSIGTPSRAGTSSSSAHRRSRSLSRFSRKVPAAEEEDFEEVPVPKGRFVNTVRGSGFPEISLDDLAVDFFGSAERGRSSESSDVGHSVTAGSSQRRGRSVSRRGADGNGCTSENFGVGRAVSDNNSRRRRSVSVVRQQISDYEVKICNHLLNSVKSPSFSTNSWKLFFFDADFSIFACLVGCMIQIYLCYFRGNETWREPVFQALTSTVFLPA